MTNFLPSSTIQQTAGDTGVAPGNAPVPASGIGNMQGNPSGSQYQPMGVQPPQPMNGTSTSGASGPAQMSNAQIPVNVQPINLLVAPGLDSLMAQISRGQLSLNQSNYGQPGALAPAIGQGPAQQQTTIVPNPIGFASALSMPLLGPPSLTSVTTSGAGGSIPNGLYFVKVTALLTNAQSVSSNEQSILVAAAGSSTITVTWTPLAGAAGYNIYIGTTSGGENTYVAEATSPVTLTTLPTLGGTPPPAGPTLSVYTGN
jgi:hypothetical protein